MKQIFIINIIIIMQITSYICITINQFRGSLNFVQNCFNYNTITFKFNWFIIMTAF